MWQRLVAGLGMFDTAGFSFTLDHLSSGGSAVAQLSLRLLGGSEATHTVQVTLNGTVLGQDTWQGRAPHNTVLALPSSPARGRDQSPQPQSAPQRHRHHQPVVRERVRPELRAPVRCHRWRARVRRQQQRRHHRGRLHRLRDQSSWTSPTRSARRWCSASPSPRPPRAIPPASCRPARRAASSPSRAGRERPLLRWPSGQVAGWSSRANAADYLIIAPDSLADAAGALASLPPAKGPAHRRGAPRPGL